MKKLGGGVAGLAMLGGCRFAPKTEHVAEPDLTATKRSVWVWADSHNGLEVDGKDGADWADLSAGELLANVGAPDYVLMLGDITHAYKEEQFERYARLRAGTRVPRWYEIVGNHDYHGTENGLYARFVRDEHNYVVEDGNLAWIFVSAERGRAAGIIRARTRAWLEQTLAACQDRNVILCSHQLVAHTLRRSDPAEDEESVLHPVEWVSNLRRRFRVDGWLCGHEHGRRRDAKQAMKVGRTTFINVASISHAYRTEACNSFVLEMNAGESVICAHCRDHDGQRYVDRLSVEIPLAYPLVLDRRPRVACVMPRAAAPSPQAEQRGQGEQ